MNELIQNKLAYIKDCRVKDAMLYSLLAGGKRIRPRLLNAVVRGFNGNLKESENFEVALEMIHTYSLIHDDLPAMDNDELRRGKKTCHIEFDEATAILAGDGLLNEAFYLCLLSETSYSKKIECLKELAACSGVNGMIRGQELDINSTAAINDLDKIKEIHKYKTGMLLTAPLVIGCILCEKSYLRDEFYEIGIDLGLAFQIQDDILDVTGSKEKLGKSNSDIINNKLTGVTILKLDGAKNLMEMLYNDSINRLKAIKDFDSSYLVELLNEVIKREN